MTEETISEQLAEIEGQGESTPATEYTPTEHWRVLQVGEPLKGGDEYHEGLNSYIRRIEVSQPEAEPVSEPQPEPQTESDAELRIRLLKQCNDNQAETIGRLQAAIDERVDIDTADQTRAELRARIFDLETINQAMEKAVNDAGKANNKLRTQAEEFRFEISYLQNLLGESRQRVTQLEELVGSLRTINDAQEKTVRLAGQQNTDLQHRLNVVSAEWAEQAETSRRLQIELDAAQQVPAAINDRFKEGWDAGTARAVETIVEWTEPIRTCGSQRLAWMVMANLPHIMRTLTGLAQGD